MHPTRRLAPLLLSLGLALAGCTSLMQQYHLRTRSAGEKLQTHPESVWTELNCADKAMPFIEIEHEELIPPQIRPGGRLSYRMVYAMCAGPRAEVVPATVTRRIYFKGTMVGRNVRDDLEFKPGRWVVDAFFTLPEDSEPGVYTLDVSYASPAFRHDNGRTFVVTGD